MDDVATQTDRRAVADLVALGCERALEAVAARDWPRARRSVAAARLALARLDVLCRGPQEEVSAHE